MKIVVLVKEVPDTYGERKLDLETGLAERSGGEMVLDEIGERSLEVALSFADRTPETEIVVVSMGPESAQASLRRALAMGADSAVHIVDDGLLGADLGLSAEVLASAVRRTGFDLVIVGNVSTDGSGGVIPAMLAELLDIPAALNLVSVDIGADAVSGVRTIDAGTTEVSATLPAIISITEALPDARMPGFKGVLAAKKKPYGTVTLSELNIDPDDPTASRSIVLAVTVKPPRAAGIRIIDEGDAGERLADFLIQNRVA